MSRSGLSDPEVSLIRRRLSDSGDNGAIVMHITGIGIYYLSTVNTSDVIWLGCDERVNLFIGPNASGKSTILRLMKSACSGELERNFVSEEGDLDLGLGHGLDIAINLSDDWPRAIYDRDYLEEVIHEILALGDRVPFLYIPATRVDLLHEDVFREIFVQLFDRTKDNKTDNSLETLLGTPLKALFGTDSGVFQGQYVEETIDWLRGRMTGNRSQQLQLGRALQHGYSCARSICHEVIRDSVPHPFVEEGISHHSMGIRTSDQGLKSPLYAGDLSSGTQGTLLWVWALALKIASYYEWTEGWEEKPAILLIDEIENHLHPAWQRRVIPALLEHFPGLQIFATTHTPFMVAGLKAGQVHLLSRDENGVVTATTNTEDVIGWTADEILRTMMGVEEPTDQLTVDRANRLRQLREKEALTPEEETELNELRRQVNKVLLSKGGPLEAQRERYADLMREFLISRQSDLAQDGG
ncbi:MAG: AAA family ATPase [Dehalococcoidia bacterium]|nr:AAA family ATPase [Dehalococcoidia bacterium]